MIKVIDNGSGFDNLEKLDIINNKSSNFGLSIMKERIALLSGIMEIKSEKGKGTIVSMSVPLAICREDKNE